MDTSELEEGNVGGADDASKDLSFSVAHGSEDVGAGNNPANPPWNPQSQTGGGTKEDEIVVTKPEPTATSSPILPTTRNTSGGTDTPDGSSRQGENPQNAPRARTKQMIIAGVGLVIALVLVISLPLALRDDSESGDAQAARGGIEGNTTLSPSISPALDLTGNPTLTDLTGVPTISLTNDTGTIDTPAPMTATPTMASMTPSEAPSNATASDTPSATPSDSAQPSAAPQTPQPTESSSPTAMFSDSPSGAPSVTRSESPSASPVQPSSVPSSQPTLFPTSKEPTVTTHTPSILPTGSPTESPAVVPQIQPTGAPFGGATPFPSLEGVDPPSDTTEFPTASPNTEVPTMSPTTSSPTLSPTSPFPTFEPTVTMAPTQQTVIRLRNALADLSLNPDALSDRSTPENAAMRYLHDLVTGGGSSLNLNQLLNNKFRLGQRFAILTLDFATQGGRPKAPKHASGNSLRTLTECQWEGVTCNGSNRVTRIVWAGEDLPGFIPEDLGKLTSLTHLDLGENQLGGQLPESLYDLTGLLDLYLHSNQISGPISEDISSLYSLVNLYLGDNKLTGTIPSGLGSRSLGNNNVRALRKLNLNLNQLSGSIPTTLNLRNLYYCDLGHNQLTGNLPSDWWSGGNTFSSLRHLYLNNNALSGNIPTSFVGIGNGRLVQLAIENNKFTGTFPGGWDPRTFLEALSMQYNDFDAMSPRLCGVIVFNGGEMTSFGSDCAICTCGPPFCRTPHCYY